MQARVNASPRVHANVQVFPVFPTHRMQARRSTQTCKHFYTFFVVHTPNAGPWVHTNVRALPFVFFHGDVSGCAFSIRCVCTYTSHVAKPVKRPAAKPSPAHL